MDRLSLSLSTMGVGMLVVFFGLVILIACISIMTIFTGRQKKTANREAAPVTPIRQSLKKGAPPRSSVSGTTTPML